MNQISVSKAVLGKKTRIFIFFTNMVVFLCATHTEGKGGECPKSGENDDSIKTREYHGVTNESGFSEFQKTQFFVGVPTYFMGNFATEDDASDRVVIFPAGLTNSAAAAWKNMTKEGCSITGKEESFYLRKRVYICSNTPTVAGENDFFWLKMLSFYHRMMLETYKSFFSLLSAVKEDEIKEFRLGNKNIIARIKKITFKEKQINFVFFDNVIQDFRLFKGIICNDKIRNLESYFIYQGCLTFENHDKCADFINNLAHLIESVYQSLDIYRFFLTISHKDDLFSYDLNYDRIDTIFFLGEMFKGCLSIEEKPIFITLILRK